MELYSQIPNLLTLKDICTYLKLGRCTVLELLQRGEIEGAFKLRREWRITASDLAGYVEQLKSA